MECQQPQQQQLTMIPQQQIQLVLSPPTPPSDAESGSFYVEPHHYHSHHHQHHHQASYQQPNTNCWPGGQHQPTRQIYLNEQTNIYPNQQQQQQQQHHHHHSHSQNQQPLSSYYYDIDDGFSDILSAPPTPEPIHQLQQTNHRALQHQQQTNQRPLQHQHRSSPIHLWEFLLELLQQVDSSAPMISENETNNSNVIRWIDKQKGIFKIEDSVRVARLWGKRKNKPKMNYDKLSRSIRQYYKKGIMRKTDRSQRLVYQFCSAYCH